MIDYNAFIEKYYPNPSSQKETDIRRFITKVNSLTNDITSNLVDPRFLCSLFFIQDTGSISRQHYQKIKEYILNLFDYVGVTSTVPSREEVFKYQPVVCYFESLDSAFDFIDRIGRLNLQNYNKRTELVNIKTIVALGWYGFTTKQIVALPKYCIRKDKNGICYVVAEDGRLVEISERAYDYIDVFIHIDDYRAVPSGKRMTFKGDDSKLMRPTVPNQKMEEDYPIQVLRRFNDAIPDGVGYAITFRMLYKNAVFVKVYEDNSDEPILSKILKHFRCSKPQSSGYKKEYLRWLSMFHSEEL